MARSVATAAVLSQSNTLRRDLLVGRTTLPKIYQDLTAGQTEANTPELADKNGDPFVAPKEPLTALVDEVRVKLGLSQKAMAINAGVNLGTFCDAMNGKPGKNFSLAWLDKQPIEFRIALAKLLAQKYGISREAERAIVIRRLFDAIEDLLVLTVVSE